MKSGSDVRGTAVGADAVLTGAVARVRSDRSHRAGQPRDRARSASGDGGWGHPGRRSCFRLWYVYYAGHVYEHYHAGI